MAGFSDALCAFKSKLFFLICLLNTVNLALGKSTDQSSTNNYNSTVLGVSGNAVDGNPDTEFGSGHCSRTNTANPSWWRVDLGANLVPVSDVFIVNSNEQQGNKDFKITLGEYIYKLKHVFSVDCCGGCVVANCFVAVYS